MLSHLLVLLLIDIMRPTVIAVAAVVLFSQSSLLLLKSLNKSITVVYMTVVVGVILLSHSSFLPLLMV